MKKLTRKKNKAEKDINFETFFTEEEKIALKEIEEKRKEGLSRNEISWKKFVAGLNEEEKTILIKQGEFYKLKNEKTAAAMNKYLREHPEMIERANE